MLARAIPAWVVLMCGVLWVLPSCRQADPPGSSEESDIRVVPPRPPDGSYARPYIGRGIVTEIRGDVIQIDHETIPGFMSAVTMDFPLADPAMARRLEPGDRVVFSIEVVDRWRHRIIEIDAIGDVDAIDRE